MPIKHEYSFYDFQKNVFTYLQMGITSINVFFCLNSLICKLLLYHYLYH
jgi:hypothetical protein